MISSRQGDLSRVVIGLLLLSVLLIIPTAKAPPDWDEWQYVYDVDNVLPEDMDPAWWRIQSEATRSIVHNNDLLRMAFGTGSTYEEYRYNLTGETEFLGETRFKIYNSSAGVTFQVYREDAKNMGMSLTIQLSHDMQVFVSGDSKTVAYPNSDGVNYTLSVHIFPNYTNNKQCVEGYVNNDYFGMKCLTGIRDLTNISWMVETGGLTYPWVELDYVIFTEGNPSSIDMSDLEDRIADLERELEQLRKRLGDSLPETYVNQSELPTIPHRNRGLDDDLVFVDPYRTIVYDVKVSDSGADLAFHQPYPTADEVTVISDEIWIAEKSYTRLWINTTGGTELLNTTDPVTYYNIEWGYNITVQTSGASSSVRADRVTTVRLIDSFLWGENEDTGVFGHRSNIENDISYNMQNVRIYWAFPDEDNDGREVNVQGSSIEVWDDDNNLELDRGRHYEATEIGGVSLEVRWVNTTGTTESRTYFIQFTRTSHVESESFYTVYDNDIAYSDAYGNAPFTTNVHHTQHGTANFEGKIIIRFDLTGRYAGEHLDVRTLIIKRSDTSLAQEFTYDSISNELRIVDQTVDAGESITYTLYFDWHDESSALYGLILGDPLVLYSLLLLAGFAGLFIYLSSTEEEKRRKYAGIIIIAIDVVILVIVLVAG
ncbi:MAG: hypothetical protein ACXADO_00690 [Candidatus Thorarchaeota archaeon]